MSRRSEIMTQPEKEALEAAALVDITKDISNKGHMGVDKTLMDLVISNSKGIITIKVEGIRNSNKTRAEAITIISKGVPKEMRIRLRRINFLDSFMEWAWMNLWRRWLRARGLGRILGKTFSRTLTSFKM